MDENNNFFRLRLEALTTEEITASSGNLSQAKIAKQLGVNPTAYSEWINGNKLPQMKTAITLAEHFNVTLDYLFNRSEYRTADAGRTSASALGLSEATVKHLRGDTSLSPVLNQLFELDSEVFQDFLENIKRYYFSCKAACIVEQLREELMIELGKTPTAEQLAPVICDVSFDEQTSNELREALQTYLYLLENSGKNEPSIDVTCQIGKLFTTGAGLPGFYSWNTNECLHTILEELSKKAARTEAE